MKINLSKNQWEYIGRTAGWFGSPSDKIKKRYSQILQHLISIHRLQVQDFNEVLDFIVNSDSVSYEEIDKAVSEATCRKMPLIEVLKSKIRIREPV